MFFYNSIVTDELPSHNHTFTGTEVNTSGGTPHTHGRGTLNITGQMHQRAFSGGYAPIGAGFGAFSLYNVSDPTYAFNGTTLATTPSLIGVDFDASKGWSGSLATESTHTHKVTAAGDITPTGNNEKHSHNL